MKESDFKKLMMQSKVVTSEDFTENLLNKISDRKSQNVAFKKIKFRPAFWLLILVFLVVIIILFLLPMLSINLTNYARHFNQTPIIIGILFLFLASINHMLRLQQRVQFSS